MILVMSESDFTPLIMWSAITGILIAVSGLSYRAYLRRKKDEKPSP